MGTVISKDTGVPARRTPLLDTDELAEVLRVTPRHVRRLVAERRIPFLKVGRFVRFDPGELDIWLDEQRVDLIQRSSRGSRTSRH